MIRDFVKFLKEFNIISLAVGFVMGSASTAVVNSLVKDVFMPIVTPLFPGDNWREAAINIGAIHITYGAFLAELLNFVVLAFIVFLIVRKLLKIEKGK